MNTKILLDNVMRQTTVLLAQLTVSAGIRAPVAHLADEVFLRLSEELGRQGVPQKVVADMFGFALRSYQRKIARLKQGSTDETRTLWEAVLTYVETHPECRREDLVREFSKDDPNSVRSVLRDLVQSKLIREEGRGGAARFVATEESERNVLLRKDEGEGLRTLVWLDIARAPGSSQFDVAARLSADAADIEKSVKDLINKGEVKCSPSGELSAAKLFIPVGAKAGWETAVLDHFQTVCVALARKLRLVSKGEPSETTGGATFSFDIYPGHPEEERVLGLLARMNQEVGEIWDAVEAHNSKHPAPSGKLSPVDFYFGQSLSSTDDDEPEPDLGPESNLQ